MTIQIGRCGQAGYTIRNPSSLQLQGDQLSMSGTVTGLDATTLLVMRDQFRGVASTPDEPVQPIVFGSDTNLTGFYGNIQTSVEIGPGGYDNGWANWSLSATRIANAGQPQAESRLMEAVRTNDLAITNVDPWWGPPPGVTDMNWGTATQSRSTEDGAYLTAHFTTAGISASAATATYTPDPTRWYESSASFSVSYGGTLRRLIGRQLPQINAATSGAWSLSTGCVRISPSSTAGALLLEGCTSGTWRTLATVQIGKAGITAATAITSVTVTRSTPYYVACRIGFIQSSVGSLPGGYNYVDFVARRGSTFFECWFGSTNAGAGFEFNGETGATFTSGMQRSANDANGNRWFGIGANGLTTTTASSADFYVSANSGLALGGIISGNSDTTTTIKDQYFASITESVNFVTR